jgi:hypothetical protein
VLVSTYVDHQFVDQRLSAADRQVREALARLEAAEATGDAIQRARLELDRAQAKLGYWLSLEPSPAAAPVSTTTVNLTCRVLGHAWASHTSGCWRVDVCRRCGEREQLAL